MADLEIKDAEIMAALQRAADALSDLTPLMADIGENMVRSTTDRMVKGLSPDGSSFAPRSPATLAKYAREGKTPGPHPLWLTATMRQQLRYQAGTDQVRWGSNAVQAAVMQFGAQKGEFGAQMGRTKPTEKTPYSRKYFFHKPWGDIPARPFLGLSATDRTEIVEIVTEWLDRVTAG